MTEREYRVRISSPYGKQPLEQFAHFLSKVSDEAEERWGISIAIEEIEQEAEHEVDFE